MHALACGPASAQHSMQQLQPTVAAASTPTLPSRSSALAAAARLAPDAALAGRPLKPRSAAAIYSTRAARNSALTIANMIAGARHAEQAFVPTRKSAGFVLSAHHKLQREESAQGVKQAKQSHLHPALTLTRVCAVLPGAQLALLLDLGSSHLGQLVEQLAGLRSFQTQHRRGVTDQSPKHCSPGRLHTLPGTLSM